MKRGGGGGGGDGGLTHGEIIQVQGGHIVRATGRKDRHSKVFTSKGPRDRRVRLSAHTAIQFYDVQDRLGYDRPSKAVDWLMKKAKTAIDKLAELPGGSNPGSAEPLQTGGSTVMPPPGAVEAQSIADTMKSFFPVSPGNSLMNMQTFPDERITRQPPQPLQNEDLGLSLHSLQDQNLNHRSYTEQLLFSGSNPTMFESNYHPHKAEPWSGSGGGGGSDGGGGEGENRNNIGFIFNPHSFPQQLYFSQSSSSSALFSQREPLQSNYSNLLHAWNERQIMPSVDHPQAAATATFNQSSFYNIHFGSDFQVPARIRGEEDPGG